MNRHLLTLSLLLAIANRLPAGIVYDSGGFESFDTARLVTQAHGQPPLVWQDLLFANNNTFVVQSAKTNGGNRAVSVSSTSEIPAFVAPILNYTPLANELVVIEADIARTHSADGSFPSSVNFAVEAYDIALNPTVSFGLRFNDITRTIEAYAARSAAGPSPADVIDIKVAENQWVSFKAELNYDTKRYRLLVDGNEVAADLAFLSNSTNLGDVDLSHYTTVGSSDVGYYDNYSITTMAVPEPGSLGICALVCAGGFWRRRKFT